MHEFSIVQALLDRVEAEARARGASAVHHLRVRIGELSGVEPELLASAYDLARAGTRCGTAALEITRVPAVWRCGQCARAIAAGASLQCPRCGTAAELAGGDEIVLEQIALEVPDV